MLPVIAKDILNIESRAEPSNTFHIDFDRGRITVFVDEKESLKKAILLILNTY